MYAYVGVSDNLELELQSVVMVLGIEPGSPEDQTVFLTTEPCLQPPGDSFLNVIEMDMSRRAFFFIQGRVSVAQAASQILGSQVCL